MVHDEAKGIAAGAAAEAVVELLVRADGEGGGLFLVERAAGAVVLAGLLQLDARTHHIENVGAVEQVIDEGLRYQAGHSLFGAQNGPKHTLRRGRTRVMPFMGA
ncbi:hypothetical protein D3C76_1183580 [compost metagenome]